MLSPVWKNYHIKVLKCNWLKVKGFFLFLIAFQFFKLWNLVLWFKSALYRIDCYVYQSTVLENPYKDQIEWIRERYDYKTNYARKCFIFIKSWNYKKKLRLKSLK